MYMISYQVRVVVKTRGGSYPNSGLITEWAPREWNKPSDTIKAVMGSLQRGERRRGTLRHGKWIRRVGNGKCVQNHCQTAQENVWQPGSAWTLWEENIHRRSRSGWSRIAARVGITSSIGFNHTSHLIAYHIHYEYSYNISTSQL